MNIFTEIGPAFTAAFVGAFAAFVRALKNGKKWALAMLEAISAYLICAGMGSLLFHYFGLPPHVLAGVSGIAGHFHEKIATRFGEIFDTAAEAAKSSITKKGQDE